MKAFRFMLAVFAVLIMMVLMACQPKPAPQPGPPDNSTDADIESRDTEAESEEPEGVEFTIGDEDEEVHVTYSGEDAGSVVVTDESGESVVTITKEMPEGWPEDVPLMEGFTLQGGATAAESDEHREGLVVNAKGDVPLADVEAFYGDLPGWTRVNVPTGTMGQDVLLVVLERGEEHLNVTAQVTDEGTELQMLYVATN